MKPWKGVIEAILKKKLKIHKKLISKLKGKVAGLVPEVCWWNNYFKAAGSHISTKNPGPGS